MNYPEISVLIPAAGASERLGQAKQLVKYKGKSLIQNAVDTAYSLAPNEVIVVTGANAEMVKDAVQKPPVRWIYNQHWSTGMGGSIALGAASVDPQSLGVLILLCDQWRVQTQDLKALAEIWRSGTEHIVCASAEGVNMPPVIFPASCFDQLRKLENDQGARSLLVAEAELVKTVFINNAAFDLNTQAQLDGLN
jgi:CTP:molybdopterin cytidylyltransferase MocA